VPHAGVWREVINSDSDVYGGSGRGNTGTIEARDGAAFVVLPGLATILFEYQG
jgi:1,4-alpha-glucan branching enzyme